MVVIKVRKAKDKRTREAQGLKSKRIAGDNLAKVFMSIAEKPASFSELLTKTGFSKPVLNKHLKTLREHDAVYKDTIKPTETSNPSEIGKVIYKMKLDEMEHFLRETINTNFTIGRLINDIELREKLDHHAREIGNVILEYLKQLADARERDLKLELERIRRTKA